jgi:enamine deaminase RidA (YjgF/YER057c/UK114 family)
MFLSGHLPYDPPSQSAAETLIKGKVGKDLTLEDGQKAAKYCAVALLGTLKDNINSWEHVRKIVRITGYVNCVEGYEPLSKVVNGASDILVDVLGENRGLHARSAIGVASLPYGAAVEVEMVVELDDQFA